MSILWSALLLLSAFLLSRAYSGYTRAAAEQYCAFIRFLEGLGGRITCYLERIDDWCRECDDGVLRDLGFIDAYFDTGSLASAFSRVERRLYLEVGACTALSEYFARAGQGSREGELRSLRGCVSVLKGELEWQNAEWEKKRRTVGAMSVSVALGISIMLL